METPGALPITKPKKLKKSTKKNSLYFQKWNFLANILKKFLYFFKRKLFLYFQKWNPALFSQSSKNKRNPSQEKETELSYIFGNGPFEPQAYI